MWIFLSLLFLTRFCSGHFCNFSLKSIIYFLEWNNSFVKFFSRNGFLKIFSKQKLKILWMLSHSTEWVREGVTEKLVAPKLGFTLKLESAVQTSLRKYYNRPNDDVILWLINEWNHLMTRSCEILLDFVDFYRENLIF